MLISGLKGLKLKLLAVLSHAAVYYAVQRVYYLGEGESNPEV